LSPPEEFWLDFLTAPVSLYDRVIWTTHSGTEHLFSVWEIFSVRDFHS
jgi:hypothetical protein